MRQINNMAHLLKGLVAPKRHGAIMALTAGCLLAVLWAAPAGAQSPESDLEYAKRLAEQAHFDFAEEICKELIAAAPSPTIKVDAEFRLASVKKIQAQMVRDPEARKKLTDEAIKTLAKIIEANPNHPSIADFKSESYKILIEQGMWFAKKAQVESNAEERKKLKLEIESAFGTATKYLKAMIDEYNGRLAKATTDDERKKIDEILSDASYYYGLSFYYWGTSYDKNEEKFKPLLQEAIKNMKMFVMSYGDMIIAYEAADYCGLSYYELGNYKDAKEYFRIAWSGLQNMIKEMQDEFPEEAERTLEGARPIIQKSVAHYAKVANALGDYNVAIQSVEDLFKDFAKYEKEDEMQLALIEQGHAYYKMGNPKGFEIINKVAGGAGQAAREARERIEQITLEGGQNISPDMMIVSVRNLFGRGRYPDAIRQVQALMNKLRNSPDEEKAKYLPEALFIMGESFRWQTPPRYYEAIIAYESVFENPKYKNVRIEESYFGAMAARMAADSYLQMGSKGGDEADKKKKNELVEMLIKSWPESPEAKESQHNYAKDLESEEKYAEAGDAYDKVPPSSKYYIEDKFRCGYDYYLHGTKVCYPAYLKEKDDANKNKLKDETVRYLSLADQKFKGFIKFADENKDSPTYSDEDRKKIRKFDLLSYTFLGRILIHELNGKYTEAFEIMKNLDSRKGLTQEDLSSILQLKIEALAKMGKIEEAEALIKDFSIAVRNAPEPMAPVMQTIAVIYEDMSAKIVPSFGKREDRLKAVADLKAGDKDKYKEFERLLVKACDYYDKWVEKTTKATADEALAVADKLYQAAEELGKIDFYSKAAVVYERVVAGEFGEPKQSLLSVSLKQARAYTRTGKYDKALPLLEKLDIEYKDNITIKKELAVTYTEMGNSTKQKAHWNNAKKTWGWINSRVEKHGEDWWNTRYQIILVDYNAGSFNEAMSGITNLETTVNKDFDGNKWGFKDKFNALKKEIQKVLPGK